MTQPALFHQDAHARPRLAEPPTLYFTCAHRHLRAELWEGRLTPPILVAASTCLVGGRLRVRPAPVESARLWCDWGGFYLAMKHKGQPLESIPITPRSYCAWLQGMRPAYAATMDYPCEAEIAADDAAIRLRQEASTRNAIELMGYVGPWQWVPVLQGRTVEQYVQHARDHQAEGLVRSYMAIGSLCRRTRVEEIEAIVATLAAELPGTRFHLFGVKLSIFQSPWQLHPAIRSADTGAWNGRFGSDIAAFNAVQARLGISQAATEIAHALPIYADKIERAINGPKRARPGGFLDDQEARRAVTFRCAFCGTTGEEGDHWDDDERAQIAEALAANRCPCCAAPLRDPALRAAPRPRRRRGAREGV